MKGNATNMALLRGWRLAVDDVVLDLEKRNQILQWNTSTSLVVSSLFGTVLLLEKYYKACCNMHSMKPEADNQFVPHLGHMSRDQ